MGYKIKITKVAAKDLDNSAEYLAKISGNKQTSLDLLSAFRAEISRLKESPRIYQVIGYLPNMVEDNEIRFFRVKKYLAFYVIDEKTKTVSIIRFLYEKVDWSNIIINQA